MSNNFPTEFCGLNKVEAIAEWINNFSKKNYEELNAFLNPTILHNPFLLPDMHKAISRIKKAIGSKETVGIFGDFDTDGITGTAVLMQTFKYFGIEDNFSRSISFLKANFLW